MRNSRHLTSMICFLVYFGDHRHYSGETLTIRDRRRIIEFFDQNWNEYKLVEDMSKSASAGFVYEVLEGFFIPFFEIQEILTVSC